MCKMNRSLILKSIVQLIGLRPISLKVIVQYSTKTINTLLLKSLGSARKKLIILFSKDALNWSIMTAKTSMFDKW